MPPAPLPRACAAAALAAVLAAAPHARAQQPDSAGARRDTVPLSPLVVTAGKLPVRAAQVGFALSVIGPERLEAEPPLFAADILRKAPGAHVDEAAGPGGPAFVRLRGGEEVFTQVLVDGVQLNENGGFMDLQGLTLGNLDRVEIARGPQSAVFGSSAMSGVVQFITRSGRPGPARFHGSWEGGGAAEHGGSYRGAAGLSGGTPALRYSGEASTAFSRGFFDLPHDVRSHEGSLRLDAAPAPRWDATLTARYLHYDGKLPVRDGGATRVPLDPNARNERDRLVLGAGATFSPSPRWSHQLRGSAYRQQFVYSDRSDGVAQPPDFFVFDATFRFESDLWRTGVEYVGSYDARPDAGRSPFTLAWGAQWEREDLGNVTSGDFSGELELDRSNAALFAEARGALGQGLYLMAGVRAEQYQDLDTEFTPRASAVYDAVPGRLRLRAAAGRGYKAPNLQEQYVDNPFIVSNPELDPERSTSWEVGADGYGDAGRLSLSLTWFDQTFEDLIRTVPLEGDTRQINRNLGKSRARGVEWAARWAAEESWAIGTEGAWVETRVRDNVGLSPAQFPVGEPLPGRPDVVGSGYLELSPARRVSAVLRGTYVGKQEVLRERFSGPRVEIEPYLLASVNLQYALSTRSTVYLRVENALDTDYDTAFDRPGTPLSAAVGMRFDAAGRRD